MRWIIVDIIVKNRSLTGVLVLLQDLLAVLVVKPPDIYKLFRLRLQFPHSSLQFLRLTLALLQTPPAVFQSSPSLLFLDTQSPSLFFQYLDAALGKLQLFSFFLGALCLEGGFEGTHVLLPLHQLSLFLLQLLLEPVHQALVVSEIPAHFFERFLDCTASTYFIKELMVLPEEMEFLSCSFMDCSKLIVFSSEVLVLDNPLVTQPFQPLILLQQLQNAIVTTLPLYTLQERLLSHCLHKGLQHFLLLSIQCQHALNEGTFTRSQSKVQYQQISLYKIVAIGSDGGALPQNPFLEAGEIVVVKGLTQGSIGLAPPPIEH